MTSAQIKECSIKVPIFGEIKLSGVLSKCCLNTPEPTEEQFAATAAATEQNRVNAEKAATYDREKAENELHSELAKKWTEARALFASEGHIEEAWLHHEMKRLLNLDMTPVAPLRCLPVVMPNT
jgi:hypothetical protein